MEQCAQEELFVLDVTHRLTYAGFRRCSDFWKDPPEDGRISYENLPGGVLVLRSLSSRASAEISAGEWERL